MTLSNVLHLLGYYPAERSMTVIETKPAETTFSLQNSLYPEQMQQSSITADIYCASFCLWTQSWWVLEKVWFCFLCPNNSLTDPFWLMLMHILGKSVVSFQQCCPAWSSSREFILKVFWRFFCALVGNDHFCLFISDILLFLTRPGSLGSVLQTSNLWIIWTAAVIKSSSCWRMVF